MKDEDERSGFACSIAALLIITSLVATVIYIMLR